MRGVQVLKDGAAPDELAVDDHGKVDVKDDVVIDGQAKEKADELVLLFALKGERVEPVETAVIVIEEHAWTGEGGGGGGRRGEGRGREGGNIWPDHNYYEGNVRWQVEIEGRERGGGEEGKRGRGGEGREW